MRSNARLVCIVRWPVILMVLAILLTLHAAYVRITIGLAGAILLITFGVLLLLERAAGVLPASTPVFDPTAYPQRPFTAAPTGDVPAESPARAAWGAPGSEVALHHTDDTKGGQ
jgi:hypothetical protein